MHSTLKGLFFISTLWSLTRDIMAENPLVLGEAPDKVCAIVRGGFDAYEDARYCQRRTSGFDRLP